MQGQLFRLLNLCFLQQSYDQRPHFWVGTDRLEFAPGFDRGGSLLQVSAGNMVRNFHQYLLVDFPAPPTGVQEAGEIIC